MIIETALVCLALNIYHEAKNQSMLGQLAVAEVVMNRVEDTRFPDSVCEVVKQGITYKGTDVPILHKCQFSWYCDGKSDRPRKGSKEWRNAMTYAYQVLNDEINIDVSMGATHYHASYVSPAWSKTKKRTTRIDRHIFYKWERK
tara:strand:+ start:176 stop:607 length:432 start_codon:yes stop_codon:yes gene_type:complete